MNIWQQWLRVWATELRSWVVWCRNFIYVGGVLLSQSVLQKQWLHMRSTLYFSKEFRTNSLPSRLKLQYFQHLGFKNTYAGQIALQLRVALQGWSFFLSFLSSLSILPHIHKYRLIQPSLMYSHQKMRQKSQNVFSKQAKHVYKHIHWFTS